MTTETFIPTHYAIADDYDYNETHKRSRLSIWSGPFASIYEGEAYSLPGKNGYMVSLYYGPKLRVETGGLRDDDNWQEVDNKIRAAINDYYESQWLVKKLQESIVTLREQGLS